MGTICQRPEPDSLLKSTMKQMSSTLSMNPRVQTSEMFQILTLTSQNQASEVTEVDIPQEKEAAQKLHESASLKKPMRSISDFQPIRIIGKSLLGQIFLVSDIKNKNKYAMKVINKNLIKNEQMKNSALAQRYLLQALDNPFLVKLHYAFQSKSKLYLLVDFMPGGELFYLLRKEKKFQQHVAKFYAAEILLALQYLHRRNIIYRDLKPENILLNQQGHIKIADFGISKICFNKNQLAFSICGTPEYIAPQIIQGKGYDKSADWFSFGSLLYDMLTGKPPFYSKNKHEILLNIVSKQVPIPKGLSSQAQSLLKGLFQKKPCNRMGSKNGAQQIKSHQFFKDINFEQFQKQLIEPPIKFVCEFNNEGFDVLSNGQKEKGDLDISQEIMSGDSGAYRNFQYFRTQNDLSGYKSQQFVLQDLVSTSQLHQTDPKQKGSTQKIQ